MIASARIFTLAVAQSMVDTVIAAVIIITHFTPNTPITPITTMTTINDYRC